MTCTRSLSKFGCSIEAILMKHQLRWASHVTRMESELLPKVVFFGELSKGKRKRGAPRKCFKDQLKQHLARRHLHSRGSKKQWTEQPSAAISPKAVRSLSLTDSQLQQRNGRSEKSANGMTLRLPRHTAFRVQSVEGSVPHGLGSTAIYEPAKNKPYQPPRSS